MNSALLYQKSSIRGFTLIEVLIAITIGAMVIGIVAVAFSLTIQNWERAKTLSSYSTEKFANFFARQLMCLYNKPIPIHGRNRLIFQGEKSRLIFATTFSPIGISGNCKIIAKYQFIKDKHILQYEQIALNQPTISAINMDNFLFSRSINKAENNLITTVSIDNIKDFSIGYMSKDDASFRDSWNEPATAPYKVIITISTAPKSRKVIRLVYTGLLNRLPNATLGMDKGHIANEK